MLPQSALRNIRKIVTHQRGDGPCADAVAACIIAREALSNPIPIVPVRYDSTEHRTLEPEEGLLFLDFTPPPDRVRVFVDAGAIVLDHHREQEQIVRAFGPLGVYADKPGVSAALLAFWHLWTPLRGAAVNAQLGAVLGELAYLAGVRDTWQTTSPHWKEASAYAAALRWWPTQKLLADVYAHHGLNPGFIAERLTIGTALLEKDAERDAATIAGAHRVTIDGLRVVMIDGLHTSDVAERLKEEADLVLGWHYFVDGDRCRMEVSVRSRGSVAAGSFCKSFQGGGGHEHAGGFTVDVPVGIVFPRAPDTASNPYIALESMLRAYLRARR